MLRAALTLLLLGACAGPTQYTPRITAPGELTLSYDGGFKMWSQGKEIASGYTWSGLAHFTRCAPRAQTLATKAQTSGVMAVAFSVVGGVLGGAALASIPTLLALNESRYSAPILLTGAGVAAIGAVFAGIGRSFKNAANGQAIDAMNYYNDAVGSYGASCEQPELETKEPTQL